MYEVLDFYSPEESDHPDFGYVVIDGDRYDGDEAIDLGNRLAKVGRFANENRATSAASDQTFEVSVVVEPQDDLGYALDPFVHTLTINVDGLTQEYNGDLVRYIQETGEVQFEWHFLTEDDRRRFHNDSGCNLTRDDFLPGDGPCEDGGEPDEHDED